MTNPRQSAHLDMSPVLDLNEIEDVVSGKREAAGILDPAIRAESDWVRPEGGALWVPKSLAGSHCSAIEHRVRNLEEYTLPEAEKDAVRRLVDQIRKWVRIRVVAGALVSLAMATGVAYERGLEEYLTAMTTNATQAEMSTPMVHLKAPVLGAMALGRDAAAEFEAWRLRVDSTRAEVTNMRDSIHGTRKPVTKHGMSR